MKIQQWQLRKVTEPRTLADVPSSREKPVLCWVDGGTVRQMYVDSLRGGVCVLNRYRDTQEFDRSASDFDLYDQPSRPTKLEDVPDRRVIKAAWTMDGKPVTSLIFKVDHAWLNLKGEAGFVSYESPDWQLTDHCVELVETEIGVV